MVDKMLDLGIELYQGGACRVNEIRVPYGRYVEQRPPVRFVQQVSLRLQYRTARG